MEPTIAFNPAPPVNPLDQTARILAIKNLMGQGQMQQQQIQNAQLLNQKETIGIQQTQALNNAYKNALTTDASGNPTFNRDKVFQSVAASGHGSVLPEVQKSFLDLDKLAGDVQKTKDEHNQAAIDYLGAGARMIQQSNYDPSVAGTFLAHAAANGYAPQAQQIGQAISQDPTKLKTIVDGMLNQSTKQITATKDIADTGAANAKAAASQSEKAKTDAELNYYKQNGGAPGVPAEQMQMSDWMKKNPGKGPSDFMRYKASIPITMQQSLLSPEAKAMAAQMYAQTGQLPSGMRSPGMSAGILNNAAGAAGGAPNVAANKMAYAADTHSLDSLQKNFDQVSAFENTAGKNLDLFLTTAKSVVDSNSPLVNTPLRNISSKVAGSANMAAFNAARTTALTEISKVLNSSNASGVLSDSARGEVSQLIGPNATLKQIYSAANILKQDMANRHQSYQQQINDIKTRGGGQQQQPAQHMAGGAANGLTEGQTGTGSDGKKYVVKNGTWQPLQ